jgi:preprotein translocase subunit SecG
MLFEKRGSSMFLHRIFSLFFVIFIIVVFAALQAEKAYATGLVPQNPFSTRVFAV